MDQMRASCMSLLALEMPGHKPLLQTKGSEMTAFRSPFYTKKGRHYWQPNMYQSVYLIFIL
jgi:hypothetical protein